MVRASVHMLTPVHILPVFIKPTSSLSTASVSWVSFPPFLCFFIAHWPAPSLAFCCYQRSKPLSTLLFAPCRPFSPRPPSSSTTPIGTHHVFVPDYLLINLLIFRNQYIVVGGEMRMPTPQTSLSLARALSLSLSLSVSLCMLVCVCVVRACGERARAREREREKERETHTGILAPSPFRALPLYPTKLPSWS